MTAAEVLRHLKNLSNRDRLRVIEAATRLVKQELAGADGEDDPILRVAGCLPGASLSAQEIEEELYGNNQP